MSKKNIYISLFTLLGVLMSFLIHAGIETFVIRLFVLDFNKYGLGFSWNTWYLIHHIVAILLFIGGLILGFKQGKYWWQAIYVEHRYRKIKNA